VNRANPDPDEWVRVPVGTRIPEGVTFRNEYVAVPNHFPVQPDEIAYLRRSDLDRITAPKSTPAEKLAEDASPLNTLAASIHDNAVAHGFWEGERNFGEQIALMHSELSEALEEHRANRPDAYYSHDHCPPHATERIFAVLPTCKPEGVAVELIDCLIRCLDSLAALDVDVDALTAEKMAYNASRPIRHGKAY